MNIIRTLTLITLLAALSGCAVLGSGYYNPQDDQPAQLRPQRDDATGGLPPTRDGQCLCVPSGDGCSEVIC